ncbi:NAD(P)/FAD-dependent oxidoreductase [Ramlibacter henchirensis]|uniref:NAD(P)/FAD-dependent oxidoreductase n=1 Tax=Ramlibacter henchirensis TaxID=204072 RepID=A0A4Z0CAW5_9BURK|nr:NAD(P)/FAD-dependent oxidoreductase [Ramlibacter henchirensis]
MDAQVLVIGAGPAGLAVAGSLAHRGVRAEIVERGEALGTSWRNHYERLHLHTVKQYSALPHFPFPKHYPRYVSRSQFVEYLEAYARAFGLRPRFGEEVEAITRDGARWLTRCASGLSFLTGCVVLATGANRFPNRPTLPGEEDYGGRLLHSASYRDAQPFAGQRVLVVGMGNTGAEIALDLVQHGARAALSVRSPVNIVPRDVLGRPTQLTAIALSYLPDSVADRISTTVRRLAVPDLRPYGIEVPAMSPLRQLREHGRTPVIDVGTVASIRKGEIDVRPGIAAMTRDGVRFADGREEAFDAVILATGYRADVARLFPQAQVPVRDKGLPAEIAGTGPFAGVYFVGYDLRQTGGLLRSIGKQALQVAESVVERVATAPA